VLTALVATGVTNPLDRYAANHWVIALEAQPERLVSFSGLLFPHLQGSTAVVVLALWRYPASVLVSTLVVAACAWALRGTPGIALAWIAILVVGNLAELAGKVAVARPTLTSRIGPLPGLTHSFPSGHTIRAIILAAAVAWTWPRLRRPAVVWGATAPLVLIPLGDHTPTDVLGGALVALILLGLLSPSRAAGRR